MPDAASHNKERIFAQPKGTKDLEILDLISLESKLRHFN